MSKSILKLSSGGSGTEYKFADGSSFNFSDIVFGSHACDGTVIPIIQAASRSIPWSKSVSADYNKTEKGTVSGSQPYSGSVNFSKAWSATENVPTIDNLLEWGQGPSQNKSSQYVSTTNRKNSVNGFSRATASYNKIFTGTSSGSVNYSGSVNFSKDWSHPVSGTVSKTLSGNATYNETALFLPAYYNSLSALVSGVSGTCLAYIPK